MKLEDTPIPKDVQNSNYIQTISQEMTITHLWSHKFSMSESWGNGVAKVLMKIPE